MKIEQIISDAAVKAVKALYGIEAAPGTTVPVSYTHLRAHET